MCQELYQRWQSCSCWGFLGPQTCPELFRTCLGPRGEQDKKIVKWNEGMCTECWDRFVEEAREMAEAGGTGIQTNKRPAVSTSSPSTSSSYFSPSYSSSSPSQSLSTPLTQYTQSTQYSPSTHYGPPTPTSASSAKSSTAQRKRHKTTA